MSAARRAEGEAEAEEAAVASEAAGVAVRLGCAFASGVPPEELVSGGEARTRLMEWLVAAYSPEVLAHVTPARFDEASAPERVRRVAAALSFCGVAASPSAAAREAAAGGAPLLRLAEFVAVARGMADERSRLVVGHHERGERGARSEFARGAELAARLADRQAEVFSTRAELFPPAMLVPARATALPREEVLRRTARAAEGAARAREALDGAVAGGYRPREDYAAAAERVGGALDALRQGADAFARAYDDELGAWAERVETPQPCALADAAVRLARAYEPVREAMRAVRAAERDHSELLGKDVAARVRALSCEQFGESATFRLEDAVEVLRAAAERRSTAAASSNDGGAEDRPSPASSTGSSSSSAFATPHRPRLESERLSFGGGGSGSSSGGSDAFHTPAAPPAAAIADDYNSDDDYEEI